MVVGEAGIGKSECALELLSRGHKFVVDDTIEIRQFESRVIGKSPEITRDFLYVRGLGAFRVTDVFDEDSLISQCAIDLVVEFSRTSDADLGFRLGPNFQIENILGADLTKLTIPVRSGRNLAVLVETAAKIYRLWREGKDSSRDLAANHSFTLTQK